MVPGICRRDGGPPAPGGRGRRGSSPRCCSARAAAAGTVKYRHPTPRLNFLCGLSMCFFFAT